MIMMKMVMITKTRKGSRGVKANSRKQRSFRLIELHISAQSRAFAGQG